MAEEYFDLIDDATGEVIGRARRSECHGNPKLLHRSVRIMICHPDGKSMLLQKRSMKKGPSSRKMGYGRGWTCGLW